MILELLFREPLLFLAWFFAILFGITIHEFSHALSAILLGDETPKYDGRLTLNPMAHLDFMGFIFLIFAGFGWGKPVHFNPFNLRVRRFGPAIVSLAGPASNFLTTIVLGLTVKFLVTVAGLGVENMLVIFLLALVQINLMLGVFNLIPIPPLDGSKLLFAFLPSSWDAFVASFERSGPIILLGLILLDNFFPIAIFSRIFGVVSDIVFRFFG